MIMVLRTRDPSRRRRGTCVAGRSRRASSDFVLRGLRSFLRQRLLEGFLARVATITKHRRVTAAAHRRTQLAATVVTLGALLIAGCMTRLTNDERTKVEFWGTVSAETEAAVRELSDQARGELVQALPDAQRESTWQGVLDVLDDRPGLEPLTDRIQTIVDREIDAGVRIELRTPSGNARMRQLILTSIEDGLAAEETG